MIGQMTLGDDWATGEQLDMMMGDGRATRAPLADRALLGAQQDRRDALDLGQLDMVDELADVAAATAEADRRS